MNGWLNQAIGGKSPACEFRDFARKGGVRFFPRIVTEI
jgi:hypothetical protein